MSATHNQSEMTKKYLPLSIKSKDHYKIIVHKCFFPILGHSVLAAGCWFSTFGKRLCSALLFLSVGDDVASATVTLLPPAHLILFEKLDVSAAVRQFRILLYREHVVALVAGDLPHG